MERKATKQVSSKPSSGGSSAGSSRSSAHASSSSSSSPSAAPSVAAQAQSSTQAAFDDEAYEEIEENVQDWRDELDDFERRLAGKGASKSAKTTKSKAQLSVKTDSSQNAPASGMAKKSLRGKGAPLPPIQSKGKKDQSEEEIEVAREREEGRAAVANLPDLPDSP